MDAPSEWIPPSNAAGHCLPEQAAEAGPFAPVGHMHNDCTKGPNANASCGRPHSISAASTQSDDQSDLFSNYDSRRSTVSSVYSDTTCSSQQQQQQQQQQYQQKEYQQLQQQLQHEHGTAAATATAEAAAAAAASHGTDSPPSSSPQSKPLTRSRENAKELHAARLHRRRAESSATSASANGSSCSQYDEDDNFSYPTSSPLRRKRGASHRKYAPANPKAALAATEPPHENLLTKMAFAEQQRWITVQQKTFTKWLNTKVEARGLQLVDLVKDLSDGVCDSCSSACHVMPCHVTCVVANYWCRLDRLCLSIC